MNTMSFTIPEILSLIGLTQAIYILVHLAIRRLPLQKTALPIAYFGILSCAFFLDFGQRNLQELFSGYINAQWWMWFMIPPLSVLLITQIAKVNTPLIWPDYLILSVLPICWAISVIALGAEQTCDGALSQCEEYQDMLYLSGLMAGTLSLLTIFTKADALTKIKKQKHGSERYWLSFSLIIMNIGFLLSVLAHISKNISYNEMIILRTILGLGFVYLVSTSLLRLYPKNKKTASAQEGSIENLSQEEMQIAEKIKSLLTLDKIYQETNYSRKDLARECDASEITVSKIINLYFKKSFPQLINEHRIEEAKQLLIETNEAINIISQEVGFNALPTFNRVFKDTVGISPSHFKKMHGK